MYRGATDLPPGDPRYRSRPRRVGWLLGWLLGWPLPACADATITPQARIESRKIWSERCVNCHGASGKGDGPGSGPLDPKPRDFSVRSWQLNTADEQMARVIVQGGRAAGLSDQMAANPDLESKPAVVAALLEHIRSLAQ